MVSEDYRGWNLELRQPGAAVIDYGLGVDGLSGADDDIGAARLTPLSIGNSNDSSLGDGIQLAQDRFHFGGINILAA